MLASSHYLGTVAAHLAMVEMCGIGSYSAHSNQEAKKETGSGQVNIMSVKNIFLIT
jgi:hypothetical protein